MAANAKNGSRPGPSRPRTNDAPAMLGNGNVVKMSSIKGDDIITFSISFKVMHLTPPSKTQSNNGVVYKFLLGDASTTVTALAKDEVGERIYNYLRKDKCYVLDAGGSYASVKSRKYTGESTHSHDIWFHKNSLSLMRETSNSIRIPNNKRGLRNSLEDVLGDPSKKALKSTILTGVTITNGTVYRYLGCAHCTTSIKHPNSSGKYVCAGRGCKTQFPFVETKICFRVTDISITQDGTRLDEIVCFDKTTEKLLKKSANDYNYDEEARCAFDSCTARSIFNIHLSGKREATCGKWTLIGSEIYTTSTDTTVALDQEPRAASPRVVAAFERLTSPLQICVTKRTNPLRMSPETYQLSSKPQGFVFLINNLNFNQQPSKSRSQGGVEDQICMFKLFRQFGLEVDSERDVTSVMLPIFIRKFKKKFLDRKVDCCVVIIMSHGRSNEVELSDNVYVNVYDKIIYEFNGSNCSHLNGIPKIFIIATCQDFSSDRRPDVVIPQPALRVKDTFIWFPAMQGFSAARRGGVGSWFIYSLAQVLMNHAHDTDLAQMATKLQRSMAGDDDDERRGTLYQVPTALSYMFDKFFFNPL